MCNFAHNVLSQKKKQCSKLATETLGKDVFCFRNNIKNIRTTSPGYQLFAGGNCAEPCLGQFVLEYIPIWNQVQRSVISTIVEPYILFYEKWEIITEIFDLWEIQNVSIFYFWKSSPKNGQIAPAFYLIFKEPPFRYHKVRHLKFL